MIGTRRWLSLLTFSGLSLLAPIACGADPIPPLCDGTVQTQCLLGDSGWAVTVPPHVRITFLGLDRPSAGRQDTWFLKTYDVVSFQPVTLRFDPIQPERIVDSFFRMDELVTNETMLPFSAFRLTVTDPQNDPCSDFHPFAAHIHPNGTKAPNPDFGGPTQWAGLLPSAGRCPGLGHENDGITSLLVSGATIDAEGGMWNPQRIRLHEQPKEGRFDTWFLTEQVVPAPSSIALLGLGALVLVLGSVRRRSGRNAATGRRR